MREEERIRENGYNGVTALSIKGTKDPIKNKVSSAAWSVIMAYYFDPVQMIADALSEEYQSGNIEFDPITNHLKRTKGACSFCHNELWEFSEQGCRYNGCRTDGDQADFLTDIIQELVRG